MHPIGPNPIPCQPKLAELPTESILHAGDQIALETPGCQWVSSVLHQVFGWCKPKETPGGVSGQGQKLGVFGCCWNLPPPIPEPPECGLLTAPVYPLSSPKLPLPPATMGDQKSSSRLLLVACSLWPLDLVAAACPTISLRSTMVDHKICQHKALDWAINGTVLQVSVTASPHPPPPIIAHQAFSLYIPTAFLHRNVPRV